ncbi:uncharacterized protein LOC144477897, partial [Augochlora pura]
RCKILYTDTDSLIYRITCDDVYETIRRDIDRYDTSNYDRDNAYGVPIANSKVIGLMKDENGGKIMMEFEGLRSKMYATRVENKKDVKKIKGISTNIDAIAGNYFKFIEICVRVDENMCVELILGDNRSKEISFSMSTWKQLLKTKDYIDSSYVVTKDNKEKRIDGNLSLQIVNFKEMDIVKLFDFHTSIYVTKETMYNLYKLELCIDHKYSWLLENIPEIQDRFVKFVDIVRNIENNNNYAAAILVNESFQRNCLLDCELLAVCLDVIISKANR